MPIPNTIYGLSHFSSDQIKALAHALEAEELNPYTIYKQRPDALPERELEDVIKKMSPEEASDIVPDSFSGEKGIEIVSSLSLRQLEKIGSDGDPILKETIKISLEKAIEKKPGDFNLQKILNYINNSPAWQ
ncbi:MAG: hypothetical protein HYV52_02005 [Parcubacteria group bacterium]|nr:hypothetical protein [Parcubacteria group bacterium]